MKRTVISLLSMALSFWAIAQNHTVLEPVMLECRYLEQMVVDTLARRTEPDTVILQLGKTASAFFSKDLFFVDSLCRTPNGFQQYMRLMTQYLKEGRRSDLTSNGAEYIYQNYPEGSITTRSKVQQRRVEIEEIRETIAWTFRDSVKQVLGYECLFAEADFRGRHWEVWYTLEIPSSAGPWKLWGLPGLICEAADAAGHYSWTLVSVNPDPVGDIRLISWADKYQRIARKDYYRAMKREQELMMDEALQSGHGELTRNAGGYDYKELDWK